MRIKLLVTSLFLYSGCTTLDVKIPVASIKSPEVILEGQKQINFSATPTKTLTTTTDASKRPPEFINEIADSNILNADFNYGMTDKYMIGAGLSSDVGVYFQVQYQFLNLIEENKGLLSSIYFNVQYDSTNRSGDQKGTFGPGGYDWKASLVESQAHVGVSIGYRINENFMTYAGYAINGFSARTTIEQKVSKDSSDLGGNYSKNSSGKSQSIGLGLQWGNDRISLKPVVEWTTFSYENLNENSILGSLMISMCMK